MRAEKQFERVGETRGIADHDHDLVHELNKRLDSLWKYDQYIANAEGKADLQGFWREEKGREQESISRLKELVSKEVKSNCF